MTRQLVLSGLQIDELCDKLVDGRLGLHQVPFPLARWYYAGVRDGDVWTPMHDELRAQLAASERMADFWFLRAHYTEAEIEAMHRAAVDRAFESGAIAWLDDADPSVSWSDARAFSRRAS